MPRKRSNERKSLTASSAFTALADTAQRTIAGHETLVLSDRDRAAFFDALLDPPAPNERLVRAMAAHKRLIAS